MNDSFKDALRDALAAEPPVAADARIRAAIRASVSSRRHFWRWVAAAASLVVLVGGFLHLNHQREKMLQEDAELMLEITGMASVEDSYAPRMVML